MQGHPYVRQARLWERLGPWLGIAGWEPERREPRVPGRRHVSEQHGRFRTLCRGMGPLWRAYFGTRWAEDGEDGKEGELRCEGAIRP